MAKVQTRRTISISRDVYTALQEFCADKPFSMSEFVTLMICDRIGAKRPKTEFLSEAMARTAERRARTPEERRLDKKVARELRLLRREEAGLG